MDSNMPSGVGHTSHNTSMDHQQQQQQLQQGVNAANSVSGGEIDNASMQAAISTAAALAATAAAAATTAITTTASTTAATTTATAPVANVATNPVPVPVVAKPAPVPVQPTTKPVTAVSVPRHPQPTAYLPSRHGPPPPPPPPQQTPRGPLSAPIQQPHPVVYHAQAPRAYVGGVSTAVPAAHLFDGMKLRRGKWTAEEEAYAEFLIAQFEKGLVEGCENGSTLRSFLSKKLHCQPMRISKKFAGKSIGKHVFLSRRNPMTDKAREKLKELESKFYQSLQHEIETPTLALYAAANSAPPTGVSSASVLSTTNPVFVAPPAVVPNNFVPYAPQHFVFPVLPRVVAAPNVQQQQQQQLHQSFLSALNQSTTAAAVATPSPAAPPLSSSTAHPRITHVQAPTSVQLPASVNTMPPIPPAATPMPPHAHVCGSAPRPASAQAPSAPAIPPKAPNSSALQPVSVLSRPLPPPPPPPGAPVASPPPLPTQVLSQCPDTSSPSRHDSIPDFLSGFDRVASSNNVSSDQQSTPSAAAAQHSPPFTSRSFDDFHRFLGKGLSFDLASSADGASVTADSYAIFAQQSVHAVSQHSAYCRSANEPELSMPATRPLASPRLQQSSNVVSASDSDSNSTHSTDGPPLKKAKTSTSSSVEC